jgi:hypothetical protein
MVIAHEGDAGSYSAPLVTYRMFSGMSFLSTDGGELRPWAVLL